jgi:hypothetical protein
VVKKRPREFCSRKIYASGMERRGRVTELRSLEDRYV